MLNELTCSHQELTSFVLWNHRQNMADTTDDHAEPGEEAEEEPQTEDEEEVGTVAGMSTLLDSNAKPSERSFGPGPLL